MLRLQWSHSRPNVRRSPPTIITQHSQLIGASFILYGRQQMAAFNRAERIGIAWLVGLADVGRQLVQSALPSFRAGSTGPVETRAGAGLPLMASTQVSALLAQA